MPSIYDFKPPSKYNTQHDFDPSSVLRFDRVAEVVVQDIRDEGRDRYKFYRDRGFPLHHHELDEWETDPH